MLFFLLSNALLCWTLFSESALYLCHSWSRKLTWIKRFNVRFKLLKLHAISHINTHQSTLVLAFSYCCLSYCLSFKSNYRMVNSRQAIPALSYIFKYVCTYPHTLWEAAWPLVKGSLLKTGPGQENWSPAKQDSYKVEHGRPHHVCRDLKPLSPKLCLHFVQCRSWTGHRKAFSYPSSVHTLFTFHFFWLDCFLTVDSVPVY